MIATILNIDTTTFSLNGIEYKKIFVALAKGSDAIQIVSAYDSKLELLSTTKVADVTVGGLSYNQDDLISALKDVLLYKSDNILSKLDKGTYTGDAQDLKDEIDSIQFEAITTYQNFVDLPDASALSDGVAAKVVNDADSTLNGYYSVVSGAWVKDADLVENTVSETNASKAVSGLAVKRNSLPIFVSDKNLVANSKEFTLLDALVDFWADDAAVVNGKEFRFRAVYRNDGGTYDRFGIKEITGATNIWTMNNYPTLVWDNEKEILHFVLQYLTTNINILLDPNKIPVDGYIDDTYLHKLIFTDTPKTYLGQKFKTNLTTIYSPDFLQAPYNSTNIEDVKVLTPLVDFWVDDASLLATEEFYIRSFYKNHATFSDRFSIKEVTSGDVVWSANVGYDGIVWDDERDLSYFRFPYNGTYLNFIFNPREVVHYVTNQDVKVHRFVLNEFPTTPEGNAWINSNNAAIKINSLEGKSLAVLGDSILMAMSSQTVNHDTQDWDLLKTQLKLNELINCAIGGSTWQDRGDVNITDTPVKATATATISNGVRMLKRLITAGRITPEVIIVGAGTNDTTVDGDYATVMAMTFAALEADEAYRQTMFGALRYNLEVITRDFPAAQIIIFTPFQSATATRTYDTLKSVGDAIMQMAHRYSCKVIDGLGELGVVDFYENDGSAGRWLGDGVHLSTSGRTMYTNFISNKVDKIYFKKS